MIGQSLRRLSVILLALVALLAACDRSRQTQPAQPSALSGSVKVERIASVESPTAFAVRPGDPPGIIYVASQTGKVFQINTANRATTEIASLRSRTRAEGERGLLGLAFSPDGNEMYVHFTDLNGTTNVSAIELRNGVPDMTTMRTLLTVEQPYANHNGGQLLVDEGGNLLIGLGDGGSSGDPLGHAQNPKSLLGKILRIAPEPRGSAEPFTIPPDNPFVQSMTTAPEIAFLGLRNPWRFSIDRANGDFWIADVGQSAKEEINRVGRADLGANFGWNVKEGTQPFKGSSNAALTSPIHQWDNVGGSSAIGGFVYRGSAISGLQGLYLYADFAESGLFLFDPVSSEASRLDLPVDAIVGFGEDLAGEIYVLSLTSGVFVLQPSS